MPKFKYKIEVKNTQKLKIGGYNANRKLESYQKDEIRALYEPNKIGYLKLAKMYDVDPQTIKRLVVPSAKKAHKERQKGYNKNIPLETKRLYARKTNVKKRALAEDGLITFYDEHT